MATNVQLRRGDGTNYNEILHTETSVAQISDLRTGNFIKPALLPTATSSAIGAVKLSNDFNPTSPGSDVALDQAGAKSLYQKIQNLESPIDYRGSPADVAWSTSTTFQQVQTALNTAYRTIRDDDVDITPGIALLIYNSGNFSFLDAEGVSHLTTGYWLWVHRGLALGGGASAAATSATSNSYCWEPAIDFPEVPQAEYDNTVGNSSGGIINATMASELYHLHDRTTIGTAILKLTNPSAITFLRINANNTASALNASDFRTAIGAGTSSTTGTVTSVAMTVPTGLTIGGSPITGSGTLALSLTTGYGIPTTAKAGEWDTAKTHADNVTTAVHGATTVGYNIFKLTNPGAITFLRMNANNTVDALDAATFRTAIGASNTTGTVTSVSASSPLASSGGNTPTISVATGYTIPDNASLGYYDGAYNHSVATTGSQHGATTVGSSILRLTNPSAITFLRMNANNTVDALDAANFRTAIGAGTSSTTGTVTSIATSGSISGGTITTSGTITHLTTDGHKHIPSGGAANQILKYNAAGTAEWVHLGDSVISGYEYSKNDTGAITATDRLEQALNKLYNASGIPLITGSTALTNYINSDGATAGKLILYAAS